MVELWVAILASVITGVVTFALGFALGFSGQFWRRMFRAFERHEAKIKEANAELDKRLARGCRQTDGRI